MPLMQTCWVCGTQFPRNRVGRLKLTCSESCKKKRNKDLQNEWRDSTPCPDHLHGTRAGWSVYRCSCVQCRANQAAYRADLRRSKKAGI